MRRPICFALLVFSVVAHSSSLQIIQEGLSLSSSGAGEKSVSESAVISDAEQSVADSSVFFFLGGKLEVKSVFPDQFGYGFGDDVRVYLDGREIFHGSLREATNRHWVIDTSRVGGGQHVQFSISYTLGGTVYGPFTQEPTYALGAKSPVNNVAFNFHRPPTFFVPDSIIGTLALYLRPDSSTAVDLRPPFGPPLQLQPLIPPRGGDVIYWAAPFDVGQRDVLWLHTRTDSLRFDPEIVYGFDFPILHLGTVQAGDTLKFSLISGVKETQGQRMYPMVDYRVNDFPPPDDYWLVNYENWIDDDFYDFFDFLFISEPRYRVRFDKESASPGDTVRMFVDRLRSLSDPSETEFVDVNILEGRGFAVLHDSLGRVYGNGKDIFITQLSNVASGLRVVIDSSVAGAGLQRIIVQVICENDEISGGRGVIRLGKKQLKILDHEPHAIWPVLPSAQRKGLSEYNPKRGFTIEVLDALGGPVKDDSVRIKTEFVPMSGGHNHNDPALPDSQQGRFYGQARKGNPLILKTDTTGRAIVDSLVASQIAGQYIITASLGADSTVKDTVNLSVRVARLQPLVDNSSSFDLVGGTCEHRGPGGPVACETPDNNHYAAKVVRDSLPLMAGIWVDSLKQLRLFVNDISLPGGGLFDVAGDWRPEHQEHHDGLDVDIRTEISSRREGVRVRGGQGKWVGNPKFEELARRFGVKKMAGHKKGTDREHYHLDY